jgi:DNA-directed RNA polymerase specialized sigma24 family protein
MFGRKNKRSHEQAAEFATRADFEKIFTEDMHGLHLLSLLLTADQARAEQAFVAGLEDSIHGNPVFRQWARSWSKRAIIKNAIKLVSPVSAQNATPDESVQAEANAAQFIQAQTGDAQADALIACVTRLEALQRFVFVMAILEGYSTTECAALLACSPQQILSAKGEVLQHMGSKPCSEVTVPRKYDILAPSLMTRAQVA